MLKLFARWFLLAAALLLVATLYPGLEVRGFGAALMAIAIETVAELATTGAG